jgi:hypothetical protein
MTCDPVARVFAPGGRRLEGSSLLLLTSDGGASWTAARI